MKSTQERLAESYCRPKTEGDVSKLLTPIRSDFDKSHVLVGYITNGNIWSIYRRFAEVKDDNRTEIPVSYFLDLLHDRIAPWRLEEDGFEFITWEGGDYHWLENISQKGINIKIELLSNYVTVLRDMDAIPFEGITTYTDLITLIRLIG